MIAEIRAYYARHWWAFDITLLVAVTVAAAILRLALLGEIPYGVHSDEAQLGTDGRKILDGRLWTVYTQAVLGQPSGHAFLTLPSFLLFGWTPLALRLPLALVGLAAVPLLYLVVRQAYGRAEAFFAAAMLTVSYWHLFYSRVAHWSISYGTIALVVLLCLLRGMNTRSRGWFAAGGVFLGLGFYTYNLYPIAVIAISVFLAIMTWTRYRGAEWRWWRGSLLLFVGVAFVVALPMIIYVSNPDSFYWFHVRNYSEVGVMQSPEYKDADFFGRARLIAEQVEIFVGAYAYDPVLDYVDGNGIRPMFDKPTVALLLLGLGFGWRERRNPVAIAALCCLLIIPLPAVLQNGSIMRQPLAAAPFAMFFAALPLAALWRLTSSGWHEHRPAALASGTAAFLLLAVITTTTVHDYFWVWRKDPWPRDIYFSQMTTSSDYMRGLPGDAYVLFYNERAPLSLEIVQFLAPDVEGEDRSNEFSNFNGSISDVDRSRPTAFLLFNDYAGLLTDIEERYPGGTAKRFTRDGKFEFVAYELPAE